MTLKVVLGRRYQLQSSKDFTTWLDVGPPFVAEEENLVQEFVIGEVGQFFRVEQVP